MKSTLQEKISAYLQAVPNRTYKNIRESIFLKVFGKDAFELVQRETTWLNSTETFSLRVRCFCDNMTDYPKCDVPSCNNRTKFDGAKWGKTCSKQCNIISPSRLALTSATNIANYGHAQYFASAASTSKIQETNLKKYGSTTYLNSKKRRDECNVYSIDKIDMDRRKEFYSNLSNYVEPLFEFDDTFPKFDSIYNWKCIDCGCEYESCIKDYNYLMCPECGPSSNNEFANDKDNDLKDNINEFLNLIYSGSYRFIKPNMFIDQFGVDAYSRIFFNTEFLDNDSYPFSLKVRSFVDELKDHPICSVCSKKTQFDSNTGWQEFCSTKCSANSNARMDRLSGRNNYFSTSVGKNNIKSINLKKYGTENYTQSKHYKDRILSGDIILNPNPDKIAYTVKRNSYYLIDEKFKDIEKLFTLEEYLEHGAASYHRYEWKCKKCSVNFKWWLNMGYSPECPKCAPVGTKHENMIGDFLFENKIEFIYRDRKHLGDNLEMDIFIPSHNIGIEIDGLYYHHDKKIDRNYHLMKTKLAESNGIRLIHIFGDEILRKPKIVFSKLKSILNLRNKKRKIVARDTNCKVVVLDPSKKTKFFNKYHIQGNGQGSIHLGLEFKGRLVAAMELCNTRNGIGKEENDDNAYELMRYSTIKNFSIVGGMGKLLSYFKKNYTWSKLITYADRRWSSMSNMYERVGMKLTTVSRPNYWYTKTFTERLHRSGFRKSELSKKLQTYNPNESEYINMCNNGYYRVWDCGTLKYELINK